MPSYTYTGEQVAISFRGFTFPHGEAVEVEDTDLQTKLDRLPYFESDKPKPKPSASVAVAADPIPREQAEWMGLNYIADRMALKHNATNSGELFNAIIDAVRVQVAKEITPAEPVEAADEETEDEDVDIPSDWRELHHSTRIKLAKRLPDGEAVESNADAIALIELELERRDLNP